MAKNVAEATAAEPRVSQEGAWPFSLKQPKPRAYEAMVTPTMAADILALDDPNRPKSLGTVHAYARRMADNKWLLNGEAIKFDVEGRMLDGQHRLEACVEAGMPFQTLVVVGLQPEAQDTMDDPRKRTVNDQQALRGLNLPKSASAAARWLLLIRLGTVGRAQRSTNSEVLDVLIKHRGLEQSALLLKDKDAVMLPSILVTLHYIGSQLLGLSEKANSFVEVMTTGIPAYEGDPAHQWREQLSKTIRRGDMVPATKQWTAAVHAWNLFVVNATPKRFVIPDETQIENLDVHKI